MLAKIFRSLSPLAFAMAALALIVPAPLTAQAVSSLVTTRLTQPIDENSRITLKGTMHVLANAANDRGAAPDSMPLDRLQLILKSSDAQESSLKQLINDLHTPGSSSYHKWLTPEQFGKQFGPSDQDIATVQAWLQSHGFSITKVNPGRQTMEISGNVAQFRDTFHAQIHKYMVDGTMHYANASDPQIPTALAPVVGGFATLNNFPVKSYVKTLGKAGFDPRTGKTTPEWTRSSGSSIPDFALSPGDYAVQYDLNPLYNAGVDGTGQTIAIVNDSNVNVYLVNQFRSLFSLPTNPPQVIIDGNDPGVNGDAVEAYLDVEWAGAVAPKATVDLVIAASTALEGGLYLALEHAIYSNIAPVLSLSFGACEKNIGTTNQFLNHLYEQGAAQGITILVSSGDAGAATCDNDNTQYYAVHGQAVSGFASTPYNIAVGGTDFFYSSWDQGSTAITNQLATYWDFTTSNNTPKVSIKGVIPEQPWNVSQYAPNIFDYYATNGVTSIAGGGGGASNCATGTYDSNGNTLTCTAGYSKPAWQTGTGVPADHVRDLPDLSLFASSGANASFYVICADDGDCQPVASTDTVQIFGVGGTSASTPSFAGIMALVNQKYGRQGQANFVLYPLATQVPTAFHDVTNGTISVPCSFSPSTTGCISVSNPITVTDPTYGTAVEGQIGSGTTPQYNATSGYDLASGLGTVDANVLVTNWNSISFTTSSVTMSSPTAGTYAHGSNVNFAATVTGNSPTGDVALMTSTTEPNHQGEDFFTLNGSGMASGMLDFLPGGTYNVWAHYGGDSKNTQADSAKTQITVTPEASGVFLQIYANGSQISSGTNNIPYGTYFQYNAQVAPSSKLAALEACFTSSSACPSFGAPTGIINFSDNSTKVNTAVINAEGDAEYAPYDPIAARSVTNVGSHSITASYPGDNSYNASASGSFTYTVVKSTPTLVAGYVTSTVQGQAIPLYVLVQSNGNGAAPTGTVTLSGTLPAGTPSSATIVPEADNQTGSNGVAIITVPATAAAGTYTLSFHYAGDSNYNSADLTNGSLTISSASSLKASTTSITANMSATSPASLVSLTVTVTGSGTTAPTGTIDFIVTGFDYGSFSLTPVSGTDKSTLTVSGGSTAFLQGANLIVAAYSGDSVYASSNATIDITNNLSDFSIIPQNATVPVTAGSSGTDTINLSSENGFSGAVTFTCTGTTVTCSVSSSATLSAGSTAPLTLTINAGSSVATGNYNVLVTGKDSTGHYIHTLNIQAAVTGTATTPSFTLSASPTTLSFTPGATAGNTTTISVTPSNGFTGNVDLTCAVTAPSGATSPATCSLNPTAPNVTGSAAVTSTLTVDSTSTTTPGTYTVTVTGTSGTITQTTTVTVTISSPNFSLSANPTTLTLVAGATTGNTSVISVTPSNGFTGNVPLACAVTGPSGATSPATCSLSPTAANITGTAAVTSTLTVTTTATTTLGTYTITVTGTAGSLTQTTTVTVMVTGPPSFALSSDPTSLTLAAGATTGNTTTISVTPSNGFTGNVDLTCAVTAPSGATSPATCALNPTTADVTGTSAATSTLTITSEAATTAGSYTVTVTGTSGSITQTTTVTVTLTAGFTLTSSGNITIATQGGSGTSTITVNNYGGFNGTVSLSCTVTSSGSSAPTCTVSPATTTTTATLTVNTAAKNGSYGALQHPLDKFFLAGGGAALAGLLLFGIPARRRSWRTMLGVLVFGALVGFGIGCGGSSNKGTPVGTYTVTVNGSSGSTTASVPVSVNVQ